MNRQPLISIALCTWNGAPWLRQQLDSLLAQRGVHWELVALDDASDDASLAILHEYARADNRIRVHANPRNLGHLRSFEKCMQLCRGDFIAPCDQDDIWHPEKLHRLYLALGDASLIFCDSRYVDGEGQASGRKISDDLHIQSHPTPLALVLQNTVSGHAALLPRATLEAALPFPEMLYHDWWLALVAASRQGCRHLPEVLVDFRRHPGACSAVGRQGGTPQKPPKAQREAAWFATRAEVARQFALRFPDHPESPRLAAWGQAFAAAARGRAPKWWAYAWQARNALPNRPGWFAALRITLRLARKARAIPPSASEPAAWQQ